MPSDRLRDTQGAATDVAGLSQVDPLRVSPPDGASIPSAIGFGWGVPSFAVQLPALSAKDAAAADDYNRAIILLSAHGLLTGAERDRAIQRTTRWIETCLRKEASDAS